MVFLTSARTNEHVIHSVVRQREMVCNQTSVLFTGGALLSKSHDTGQKKTPHHLLKKTVTLNFQVSTYNLTSVGGVHKIKSDVHDVQL